MVAIKLAGWLVHGISGARIEERVVKVFGVATCNGVPRYQFVGLGQRKVGRFNNVVTFVSDKSTLDFVVDSSGHEERISSTEEHLINGEQIIE